MTISFTRLRRIALLVACATSTATAATAQTRPTQTLETVLRPGMTVWITDAAGREERARIVDVSGGVVTTSVGVDTRRLQRADIVRIRARHSDSLLNGALIGAGVAVVTGLSLCRMMEPWENCRDDIGPMLGTGAIGAGIGAGVDALIRGRRTIYEGPRGSARIQAVPILTRRAAGVRMALAF